MTHSITNKEEGTSNPATSLRLHYAIDAESKDMAEEIQTARVNGLLSKTETNALLSKNRAVQKQEGPFATPQAKQSLKIISDIYSQGASPYRDSERQARESKALMRFTLDVDGGGLHPYESLANIVEAEDLNMYRPNGFSGEMNVGSLESFKEESFKALHDKRISKESYESRIRSSDSAINMLNTGSNVKELVNGFRARASREKNK